MYGMANDDGRRGERAALRYLCRRSWLPVATNWEGAGGELDLVVRRRGILAIVEVKTRGNPTALDEPVGLAQRRRIIRAAKMFLAGRPDLGRLAVRFDLVRVDTSRRPARISHTPGAFSPPDPRTAAAIGRRPS